MAWASALRESFDCSSCNRRKNKSFLCPLDHHIDKKEVLKLLAEKKFPSKMPMIFRIEDLGYCPRLFIGEFAAFVSKAFSWWETGQLGLTLITAPAWVDDSFTLLTNERSKARAFLLKK